MYYQREPCILIQNQARKTVYLIFLIARGTEEVLGEKKGVNSVFPLWKNKFPFLAL